jgi:hypothetical protein
MDHFSLHHAERYRGILFLTTNRVQAFDEAFLSRIDGALGGAARALTAMTRIHHQDGRKTPR